MNISYPDREDLISWRRKLHCHAEPGFAEFWTTAFIYEQLMDLPAAIKWGKDILSSQKLLGYPPKNEVLNWKNNAIQQGAAADCIEAMENMTGLAVDILPAHGISETPSVLLRFDIDAVPVPESQETTHKPFVQGFSSINPNVSHACGHDGHTAIGIGVAKALCSVRNRLRHGVRILFQPAEEGVRGAYALQELCKGIRYMFAGHIGMKANTDNSLVCGAYGFYATTKFDVTYKGLAAHAGAEPEKGKNALLAACSTILNLYALPRNSKGETRINIGTLYAGTGRNVIADTAFFQCETRGANTETNKELFSQAQAIIDHTAKMYGQESILTVAGSCDSAESDTALTEKIKELALTIPYFHHDKIRLSEKGYGSDDACTLMRCVQEQGGQAAYLMLGSGLAAGHHDRRFDFNENLLLPATELFTKLALYYG